MQVKSSTTPTGKYLVQLAASKLTIIEDTGERPKSPDAQGRILSFTGPYPTREAAQESINRRLAMMRNGERGKAK